MAYSEGASPPMGYEQQRPRINKPDMFMNTALMMERSPQAERPYGFVPMSESTNRGQEQSADQQTTAIGETVGSGETSEALGDKDASARNEPVVQESTSNSKETSSTEVSSRQKPVTKESCAQRRAEAAEPRKCNKSGAVVVLPNDRALSVDCSQEGVHAAVSALNKFGQERAKGCQVYLSRRPCSFCAKLLVQCEVSKVYYLPIEPELDDDVDVLRVDTMFKASSAGLSIKVPRVEEAVMHDHDHRESPYRDGSQRTAEGNFSQALMREYFNEDWKGRASVVLKWPAFNDEHLKNQITEDMESLMKWIAHTTVKDVPDDIVFVEIQGDDHRPKDQNIPGESVDQLEAASTGTGSEDSGSTSDSTPQASPLQDQQVVTQSGGPGKRNDSDKPVSTGDKEWQAETLHMSRLAQMLSQRSDDPTRRVGCVLKVHEEVAAIGWNGFPAKALYGEFPRASNTEEERNKKEPYVIHAEQNALLTKNQNLHDDSSTLYINEVPCDECFPLLVQAGVKKFVIPKLEGPEIGEDQISGPSHSRRAFKLAFHKGDIECFGSKRSPARRQLQFNRPTTSD